MSARTPTSPRSERGNVYILTCIDSFTKWAEAFPIRNKEAETAAKVLVEQLFYLFGAPVSLLSDQGKEVYGKIMRNVRELLGIDKLRTTTYKPSINQVECLHRLNTQQRQLTTIIAIGIRGSAMRWRRIEPAAMTRRGILRTTSSAATKKPPTVLTPSPTCEFH